MIRALVLAVLLAAPAVSPIPGVPIPPDGVLEPELTKAATDRATAEMRAGLARLEKDVTIPDNVKRDIKAKIIRMKIAVFTTPKTLDETVAFYEKSMTGATFIFGERDVLGDAHELATASGLRMDPEVERAWQGKRGRSARWSREDKGLEIDVEDTLIDPRDAKISRKTVVLVTSVS